MDKFEHCKVVGGDANDIDNPGSCAAEGNYPEPQSQYADAIDKDVASYHYFPIPLNADDAVTGDEHFTFMELKLDEWRGKDVLAAAQAGSLDMFQRLAPCGPKMCQHKFAEFGLKAVRGWAADGDVLAIGIIRDECALAPPLPPFLI